MKRRDTKKKEKQLHFSIFLLELLLYLIFLFRENFKIDYFPATYFFIIFLWLLIQVFCSKCWNKSVNPSFPRFHLLSNNFFMDYLIFHGLTLYFGWFYIASLISVVLHSSWKF